MLNLRSKKHLALRLGISAQLLEQVAANIEVHCTIISIRKKDKFRDVAKTHPTLKYIQRRILDKLLEPLPLSPYAHGAVRGRSSKTNAQMHCGARSRFCLDLRACFPSVHSSRVRKLFEERLGCSPDVAHLLTRLTTFDYHLTQGFSTSAALLNLLCVPMDTRITNLVKPKQLTLTRYIDDIAISGNFISAATQAKIREIITSEGFCLKKTKESFSVGTTASTATGLNTCHKHPVVPRSFKRNLRALKHRVQVVEPTTNRKAEALKRSIHGKEQYIRYIEKIE